MMGMSLDVPGEMAGDNCKIRHDKSIEGDLSGKPDEKQQGVAAGLEPPDLVYHTNAHKEQRLDLSIEPFDVDSSMDMPATTLMRLKVLYSKFSLASRPRQRVGCAPEDSI